MAEELTSSLLTLPHIAAPEDRNALAARKAAANYGHAKKARQAQKERLVALKSALEGLEGRIADLAKLEEAARLDAPVADEMMRRFADCEARVAKCRVRRDETKSALDAVERDRKALELAERAQHAADRLKAALSLVAERKALADEIANNGAEEGLVAAARREAASLATIEARLSAAAPQVSVAYANGARSEIRIEGGVLKEGETLNTRQPVALQIEGVGVVTIAPGQSESLSEDQIDLVAHEKELRELLNRAGVASIDDAEERLGERRALEGKLAEVSARLRALTPDGLERLERAHAQLAANATPTEGISDVTQADLDARGQVLVDELSEAEGKLAQAERAYGQISKEQVRLSARVDGQRERIDLLSQSLGDEAARKDEIEKMSVAVAAAESGLNAAERDLAAWREKAADGLERLERAHAQLAANATPTEGISDVTQADIDARGQALVDEPSEAEGKLAQAERAYGQISKEHVRLSGEGVMTALNNEPPLPIEADSNGSIFESVISEMHSAALLTAAIASAVNALRKPTAQRSEASLKPYIPQEPAIITAFRNSMIETELEEDTAGIISGFFIDLAPARMVFDRYFADANQIGDERASTLHLLSLVNSWRKACRDALAALQQLHNDVVRQLSAPYARNSNVLTKLLAEAANGGSPCLDPEGQIRLPELPQQRHSARRTLCQPCVVTHNRNTSQAFVRDVSSSGFRLERVPQLVPDSIVFVELTSGRRFAGIVAWRDGSAAGIRFSKPLLPNDPLLWG